MKLTEFNRVWPRLRESTIKQVCVWWVNQNFLPRKLVRVWVNSRAWQPCSDEPCVSLPVETKALHSLTRSRHCYTEQGSKTLWLCIVLLANLFFICCTGEPFHYFMLPLSYSLFLTPCYASWGMSNYQIAMFKSFALAIVMLLKSWKIACCTKIYFHHLIFFIHPWFINFMVFHLGFVTVCCFRSIWNLQLSFRVT